MLTLPAANLIAAWLSIVLWGVFCCLFIVTIWVVRRKGGRWWASPAVLAIFFVFLTNAVNLGALFYFQYRAFISYKLGPNAYFATYRLVDLGVSVANDFLFACATWVVDCVMTWRLYVVFVRDKRVLIVPAILLPGSIIITCINLQYMIHVRSEYKRPDFVQRADEYAMAFYGCTVLLNWYLTLMIAGKIWWVQRKVSLALQSDAHGRRRKGTYMRVVRTLVECGALYTLVMGAEFVSVAVENLNVSSIFYHIGTRIAGIAPTLVVLQLNLGYLQPADTSWGFSRSARPGDTPMVFNNRTLGQTTNATGGVHVIRSGGGKSHAMATGGKDQIELVATDGYGRPKVTATGSSTTDEEKYVLDEV